MDVSYSASEESFAHLLFPCHVLLLCAPHAGRFVRFLKRNEVHFYGCVLVTLAQEPQTNTPVWFYSNATVGLGHNGSLSLDLCRDLGVMIGPLW